MILIDVDIIDSQALQAGLALLDDHGPIGIGIGPFTAFSPETDLRGDIDFVTGNIFEELSHESFAAAAPVDIGRVKEIDAELPGFLHRSQGILIVHRTPGIATNRPESDTDLRYIQASFTQHPVLHLSTPVF